MERDVRRLSNDIDSLKFVRFLRSVAARTSQQVNYKGSADDAEIDQTTAKNWLHAVSYTHLDVYKRQSESCSGLFL